MNVLAYGKSQAPCTLRKCECVSFCIFRDALFLDKFDRRPSKRRQVNEFQVQPAINLWISQRINYLLFDKASSPGLWEDSDFFLAVASACLLMKFFAFSVTAPSTHSSSD